MKQILLITIFIIVSKLSFSQDSIMTNSIPYEKLIELPQFQLVETSPNQLDPIWLNNAKEAIQKYEIIIILGTWCSDSQEQVPIFLNFLEMLEYPKESVRIYGLNEAKQCEIAIEKEYNIQFVPTFIFKEKSTGKEKYRIVEQFEDHDIQKSFSKALLQNK